MDPNEFLRRSSLRWHNGGGRELCSDRGVRIAGRGDVVASWLESGRYDHSLCYYKSVTTHGPTPNTPPVTTWSPEPTEVVMTSNELTSPSEKDRKPLVQSTRWGFYLDLDNDAWPGVKPPSQTGGSYPNAPRMYVEHKPGRSIVYWFFSGRNNVKIATFDDVHEGDWERIVVRLDSRNRAKAAAYYQHYCPAEKHSWASMRRAGALYEKIHPRVYVARGAHASYWKPGTSRLRSCSDIRKGSGDLHRGGGVTWKSWQRGSAGFADATKAPWYGFGGGWGHKTTEGDDAFWGPLGPGPLKKAVPKDW